MKEKRTSVTVSDVNDLIRILNENPEWRHQLRRVLLTEELLQLPELVRELADLQRQQSLELVQIRAVLAEVVQIQRQHSEMLAQHSEAIDRLTEAQRRTDERLEQLAQEVRALAEAQRRTDERLHQLAEEVRALAEAQRRTEEQMEKLAEAQRRMEFALGQFAEWQRGEAGRREGEQYEQRMIRRAPAYFAGGEGGSPAEFPVRSILSRWLAPLYEQQILDASVDPALSDIIWWKGNRVLVVEVSQKVNGRDVHRARQRADTLREVGIDATPVIIGQEWATDDTAALAQKEGVEWIVEGEFSQGLLQFRRLRVETTE